MVESDEFMKIRTQEKGYCHIQDGPGSELQVRAKRLCCEYNKTSPDEEKKRYEILHELLGTCPEAFVIQPAFQCDYGFNIHIHGFSFINYNCCLLDTSPIHIGHMTFIAPGCVISCAGHAIHPLQRAKGVSTSKPIYIEDNVWIGANCTICGGVRIGKGSVIGAGNVVTKDIPAGVVAAGVPCKVLHEITDEDLIPESEILR